MASGSRDQMGAAIYLEITVTTIYTETGLYVNHQTLTSHAQIYQKQKLTVIHNNYVGYMYLSKSINLTSQSRLSLSASERGSWKTRNTELKYNVFIIINLCKLILLQ